MLRALSVASGPQPAGRMPYRERHAGGFPRLERRHRAYRDAARAKSFEQIDGRRIGRPAETGRDVHNTDREAIEQVRQAVKMILVGVAQEDGVDPADSARPERRRDNPTADARVAQPPAVVQKGTTVRGLDDYRQAMPDRQELGLSSRGRNRKARREQPARSCPAQDHPPRQCRKQAMAG